MEIFLGCVCLDGRFQTCRDFASVAPFTLFSLKKKKPRRIFLDIYIYMYVCMYVCIPILVAKPVLCSLFLLDLCLCSCYYELILWCSCYYELDYDQGCRKSKSIFKEMVERPGILKPWKFLGQDPSSSMISSLSYVRQFPQIFWSY